MSAKKKKKPVPAQAKVKSKPAAQTTPKTISNRNEDIKMTTNKAEKFTADATALNKDQMDAFMQSGNLWVRGTEEIVKTYVSLTQEAMEKNSEALKTLMGCKTLNELTETQTKLAQQSFDDLVTNATKISELTVKIATDSLEPINSQFSKTLKKAGSAAA
jgi:phasin family protein